MSTGDPELDKKLDKLMKKLKDLGKKENENKLIPITLKDKGSHFYWSITHKMFMEVAVPSELYWLPDKGRKEGKLYIFSPWLFNSGAVFLVPEEKVVEIGAN